MKKKLVLLCLFLALVFLFTGCIRYSVTIKVNPNGKVDMTLLTAVSDALGDEGDSAASQVTASNEELAEYQAKGWVYEPFHDEAAEYTGYTLTRTGIDLKELTGPATEDGMNAILDSGFTVNGKKVILDFHPFTEDEFEESGEFLSMIKMQKGYMKIILELPVKPASHNATSVSSDGKTLTWDLTKLTAADSVHAEFTLSGGSVLVWLIPLIVVIAAAAVFFLRSRKKAGAPDAALVGPDFPAEAAPETMVTPEQTEDTPSDEGP